MTTHEGLQQAEKVLRMMGALRQTAETASKNNQSLLGKNFYAKKFSEQAIEAEVIENEFVMCLSAYKEEESNVQQLQEQIGIVKSISSDSKAKDKAYHQIQLICKSQIMPFLRNTSASPISKTQQVLPAVVVPGTHWYIGGLINQANGNYEHQWFDACSVMVRRIVETLIIEVYEFQKRTADIKDANSDFLMLEKLIDRISGDSSITLGRESKRVLPLIKQLGDRSAHTRRYLAQKADVDKVIPGLRILVDELLHLASLK